ncbi:MAG: sigma-70 family RNA polymerase sigma factor, partial [Gaiellaceae bacterium]
MAAAARPESQLAEDLFTEHSRLIYAYCLRRLDSPEEAEDALQATYLNACRSLMRGFEPNQGQAWLLKVAHNVCVSRLRSKSRRRLFERPQDFQEVQDELAAPEKADDELFSLEDALAGMPEQQRRAILLREWQGLSYREVAAELGLTQSAVETLLFRARRSLAQALETTRPRPRFVHAFHPAALLASLKSGLATGVVIAASASVVAAVPMVADGAPHIFAEPAAPKVERMVSFAPVAAEPSKAAVLVEESKSKAKAGEKHHGKPAWANGNSKAKAKPKKSAPPAWG